VFVGCVGIVTKFVPPHSQYYYPMSYVLFYSSGIPSERQISSEICMISVFRREIDVNCPLLSYYAVRSGNLLATFRDKLPVPSSRIKNPTSNLEDGTDGLSRNVGKKLDYLLCNNPEERNSLLVK
jgi:hypothetical protein